jgi:hypothetical protein
MKDELVRLHKQKVIIFEALSTILEDGTKTPIFSTIISKCLKKFLFIADD